MTDPAWEQTLNGISTAISQTVTLSATTAPITAGKVIFLAANRSTTAGNTNGIQSISTASGAVTWTALAASARASTHDVNLWMGIVGAGQTVATGTVFTVTFVNTAGNRKAAVAIVIGGMPSTTAETKSTLTTGSDGGNSYGQNGSSITETVNASAALTTGNQFEVAAMSSQGTTTALSPGAGWTATSDIRTSAGSSDRGIVLMWKSAHVVSGVQSATATMGVSSGWAGCIATFPIAALPTGGGVTGYVAVGAAKKAVASRYVIVGGAKKAVVSRYVIIGGVKKSVV